MSSSDASAASDKLSNDPQFNLKPLLKNFHDQFFYEYAKGFSFELLPENEVISNSDYKNFIADQGNEKEILQNVNTLAAKGYKVIPTVSKSENEKNLLQLFGQCDGIMKVYIDFDLESKGFGGMGLVRANAHANIILYNKKGDKVLTIRGDAQSTNEGAAIAGIPSFTAKKILPLCESAAEGLIPALQKDLEKISAFDTLQSQLFGRTV